MLYRVTSFVAAAAIGVGLSVSAQAWTDNILPDQDVNTLCKFEPEAQCTGAVRIGAQLEGIDMSYASMPTMRLDRANLKRANLEGANLQITNLKGADLTLANLTNAHLHAANLQNANLTLANLNKANLLDADLSGANLQGANMVGAIIIQAKFDKATWMDGRICAEGSIGECK